jgi:hypothetical protein
MHEASHFWWDADTPGCDTTNDRQGYIGWNPSATFVAICISAPRETPYPWNRIPPQRAWKSYGGANKQDEG